jgi:hypothetical protein
VRDGAGVDGVVAGPEFDRVTRGPDADAAGEDVQPLLDPERVRRRRARRAGVEADRVQLAEQAGPLDPLEQVRVQRGALDVGAFPGPHHLHGRDLGDRCQQIRQGHAERVAERVQRVDGGVALAALERRDRVARDAGAPRELEHRQVSTKRAQVHRLRIIMRNDC